MERDLVVPQAVDVLEDQHGAVTLGKPGERLLELPAELGLLEGVDLQARVSCCASSSVRCSLRARRWS